MTKWSRDCGYGLFVNEAGCLELRINEHRITNNVPLRDHAWHFCAATFDAATGDVVLYHEPQIVYALDPIVEPVTTNLKVAISHAPVPAAIGAFVEAFAPDDPLAGSSLPAGVVFAGKYNGKIDSPRICKAALSRQDIETMKLGAQPGLTERRNGGPSGRLSEVIVAARARLEASSATRWPFIAGIGQAFQRRVRDDVERLAAEQRSDVLFQTVDEGGW